MIMADICVIDFFGTLLHWSVFFLDDVLCRWYTYKFSLVKYSNSNILL